MAKLTIGTRGSELALWQARHVGDALTDMHADLEVALEIIHTQGDKRLDDPLHKLGDKGLFTKEIQQALLDGRVDLAVHSLKDLPTQPVEGLTLGAISVREDPADALVAREGRALDELSHGAAVLSSSLRRAAQLLHHRPDLNVQSIRGNVPTRLRKFEASKAEGILFARAGLVRLGLGGRITQRLDPEQFLPACGQGALAIEVRADDSAALDRVSGLDDFASHCTCTAERALLAVLEGGCQVPVGAYAHFTDDPPRALAMAAMVANLDGTRLMRRGASARVGDCAQAAALGRHVAELLLADGCREILDEVIARTTDKTEPRP